MTVLVPVWEGDTLYLEGELGVFTPALTRQLWDRARLDLQLSINQRRVMGKVVSGQGASLGLSVSQVSHLLVSMEVRENAVFGRFEVLATYGGAIVKRALLEHKSFKSSYVAIGRAVADSFGIPGEYGDFKLFRFDLEQV